MPGKSTAYWLVAPAPPEPSMLHKVGQTLQDVGTGAAKGFANTLYAPRRALSNYFPSMKEGLPPEGALDPTNTAQKVGKYSEQAAEFLVPGAAEEKAASLAPKAIRPLARIGAAGLSAGAINKAQGGSFGAGAAAGGVGSVVGQGLKAAAPGIIEGALGIRGASKLHGATPGEAVLNETSSIRPGKIAEQARGKLGDLTNDLESRAANSPAQASAQPAIDKVDAAISKAQQRNSPLLKDLTEIRNQLTFERTPTGEFDLNKPLPANTNPADILNRRRGVNDLVDNWGREAKGDQPTARGVYGALSNEFHNAVPGTQGIDQRISSLIPVAKRAEITEQNAGVPERLFNRFARPTGALIGGVEGYRMGGPMGAAAGLVAPELLASPTTRIMTGRALNSPILPRALTGAGLQLARPGTISGHFDQAQGKWVDD